MVWVPVLFISFLVFISEIWVLRKNGRFSSRSGFSGCEMARRILDQSGCSQIMVELGSSRNRRPHIKQLCLEKKVYEGKSLTALAQAAREAVLIVKSASQVLSPDVRNRLWQICSNIILFAWLLVLLGLLHPYFAGLKFLGLTAFVLVFLTALVSLPAEFEASDHAYFLFRNFGYFPPSELARMRRLLKIQRLSRLGQIFRAPMDILTVLRLRSVKR